MLTTNASFRYKEKDHDIQECSVNKVIRLSGAEYDSFTRNFFQNRDFITDNREHMSYGNGMQGCILVVGEGRPDGVLVNSEGYDYARRTAFIPHAEGLLTVGRYPALGELNKKLADVVDHIVGQIGENAYVDNLGRLRSTISFEELESVSGIELMGNEPLLDTVFGMLHERPEIDGLDIDNNELIIYSEPEQPEDLSDPTVSRTDMYAYGYGWDGMIPLGKDRALEFFDKGYQVYVLYPDDSEGGVSSTEEIETFDGLFGVEDPAWIEPEHEPPIEVFILNREKYDNGEPSGKWLTLPTDAGALYDLFLHIGVDRPSEGAFTITAVRVPDDHIRDYISKYDSLDELNLLASYMSGLEDFEVDKFKAILTSGVAYIGGNTAALINVLCSDNFDAFELIDATDAESLARYYDRENNENPEDISFEDYGKDCIKSEGGRFTESGYIKFKYKELLPEYTGVVPDGYKITDMALQAFRFSKTERGLPEDKPSVLKQIRDAQKTPKPPRRDKTPKKKKEAPEL